MLLDRRALKEGGTRATPSPRRSFAPAHRCRRVALAALRYHHNLPMVRDSLTWILNRIDCPSAYSLAWVILSAAAYRT